MKTLICILAMALMAGSATAQLLTVKPDELAPELRDRAKALGYHEQEPVPVAIGASGELVVVPKDIAATQLRISFQPEVLMPGTVVRGRVKFADLPPDLQKRASELTYGKGSSVRLQVAGGKFEVLPPEFLIGLRQNFDALARKEQGKAAGLGYKSGDIVWSEYKDGLKMLPRALAGDGPAFEMVGAEISFDSGKQSMLPICLGKFARLKPEVRAQALSLGYKDGDDVGFQYVPSTGEVKVLKPGQAQQMSWAKSTP